MYIANVILNAMRLRVSGRANANVLCYGHDAPRRRRVCTLSPCAGTRTRVRVTRPVVVRQFDMSTARCHNLLQSPQIGHHATNAGWLAGDAMRSAQLVVLALASAYHVGPANITGPHVRVRVCCDASRGAL